MRSIFILFFLLLSPIYAQQLDLDVRAEGAILINAQTGAILYEKNAHQKAFPASTTKIATALYALDVAKDDLGKKMRATRTCIASITPSAKKESGYRSPPHWLETDGSHVGIKSGEEIPLYDLLAAILIASANDASNVVAHGLEGSIPRYMEKVNRFVKKLGCLDTSFNNPHGLHHPDHFTTPYDLALMAKAGMQNPIFRSLVSTVRYECPETNLEHERIFLQTNKLLRSGSLSYPKATGIKTGTTQAAGKNVVASARQGERELIAVLLGCRGSRSELFQDAKMLFEAAFDETLMRRFLLKKGVTDFTKGVVGGRGFLKTTLAEGLYYDFYPAEESAVKAQISWGVPPLPIKAGDCVGVIQVVDERGNILKKTELLAYKDMNPTLWYRATHLFSDYKKVLFWTCAALFLFTLWRFRKKRASTSRSLF